MLDAIPQINLGLLLTVVFMAGKVLQKQLQTEKEVAEFKKLNAGERLAQLFMSVEHLEVSVEKLRKSHHDLRGQLIVLLMEEGKRAKEKE